jgi:hypothetical protein
MLQYPSGELLALLQNTSSSGYPQFVVFCGASAERSRNN